MTSGAGSVDSRERAGSIALVALLHVALGYALLKGFDVPVATLVDTPLKLFTLAEPPPPPVTPAPKPRPRTPRREGASAPPNLTAKPVPVVAPPPVVPVPPPPIVTAPIAGNGAQNRAGAAPVVGPGTGSGGVGNGTGSGGNGDGPGGGGGGTPLRLIRDTITNRDYPRAAFRAGASGTVGVRFTVGVKGRVTDCTVTATSGNADLDAGTCRLIRDKLRYEPSRDARGRPYPDIVEGEHVWQLDRAPDGEDADE